MDHDLPPAWVAFDLEPEVHHHLVDQHQGGQAFALRQRQQFRQQGFGWGHVPFLGQTVGMEDAQPFRSRHLPGQDAPREAQVAHGAIRCPDVFEAALNVELVEAQAGDPGLGRRRADVLQELVDRRQVGERRRVGEQMQQGHQGVRLAAAVGQFQLAHGLVAAAEKPERDVLAEVP